MLDPAYRTPDIPESLCYLKDPGFADHMKPSQLRCFLEVSESFKILIDYNDLDLTDTEAS